MQSKNHACVKGQCSAACFFLSTHCLFTLQDNQSLFTNKELQVFLLLKSTYRKLDAYFRASVANKSVGLE